MFKLNESARTRGHPFKLHKKTVLIYLFFKEKKKRKKVLSDITETVKIVHGLYDPETVFLKLFAVLFPVICEWDELLQNLTSLPQKNKKIKNKM